MADDMPPDARQDARDERRADRRRTIEVDARLEHPDGLLDGFVVNISFGGAKFVTRTVTPALSIGTRVALTVTPRAGAGESESEGAAELTWRGAIVRSDHSGDDGPDRIAYAVAFDDSAPRPLEGL